MERPVDRGLLFFLTGKERRVERAQECARIAEAITCCWFLNCVVRPAGDRSSCRDESDPDS